MAQLTIQLRCEPATGKRDVVIKLHGDEDLLPNEHERLHRTLVDRLVEGGLLKAEEAGQLIIEREQVLGSDPAAESAKSDERTARPTGSS